AFRIGYSLCEAPPLFSDPPKSLYSEEEIQKVIADLEAVTWDKACSIRDQVMSDSAKNAASGLVGGVAKKVFLDWWKDYLEAMCAFEMLDGWITSPYHWPMSEDEVRAQARTQITALTDGAKKKLIVRLKEKAKKLRDKAKDLRKEGQDQKAQM